MDRVALAKALEVQHESLVEFENAYCIIEDDGCLLWTGTSDPDGYGLAALRGTKKRWKTFRVNRLVLALKLDRPLTAWALHHCDVPGCINPEHLYEGTQKDNERDKLARGRHALAKRTHCKNNHEFAKHSRPRADGRGRTCTACLKEREERYKKTKAK